MKYIYQISGYFLAFLFLLIWYITFIDRNVKNNSHYEYIYTFLSNIWFSLWIVIPLWRLLSSRNFKITHLKIKTMISHISYIYSTSYFTSIFIFLSNHQHIISITSLSFTLYFKAYTLLEEVSHGCHWSLGVVICRRSSIHLTSNLATHSPTWYMSRNKRKFTSNQVLTHIGVTWVCKKIKGCSSIFLDLLCFCFYLYLNQSYPLFSK